MNQRINQLIELQKEDPKSSFILFALAKEYATLENYVLSLKYFIELEEQDPSYVGLYYHLASVYVALDQKEKALNTYEKGIKVAEDLKDHHALSELRSAKLNYELEL